MRLFRVALLMLLCCALRSAWEIAAPVHVEMTPYHKVVPRVVQLVSLGLEGVVMSNATKNIGLRIPVELNNRLDRLAASTGRSKSYYLIRTLEDHLSETEYIYGLERDAEAIRRGELQTRPLDELWDELGIEPSDDDAEVY